MVTIKLSHSVSDDKKREVEKMAQDEVLRNPNFNGAEIEVNRDEFTCVEDSDEVRGSILLSKVNAIILGT